MKLRKFLSSLDEATITNAIHAIENDTMGRIRVFISGRRLRGDDIMDRAVARLRKLDLTAPERRHGILLYFLPLDQRFAILAGPNIHARCGEACWNQLASKVEEFLRQEQFHQAVLHAIQESGTFLKEHFPIAKQFSL